MLETLFPLGRLLATPGVIAARFEVQTCTYMIEMNREFLA
jgi:hypothetical protein